MTITQADNTLCASQTHTYDPEGNITKTVQTLNDKPTETRDYTYDGSNQLTQHTLQNEGYNPHVFDYTYDFGGNMTAYKHDNGLLKRTFDKQSDELVYWHENLQKENGEWTEYAYDKTGNRTRKTKKTTDITKENWVYNWDIKGQMASVVRNDVVVQKNAYDISGMRYKTTKRAMIIDEKAGRVRHADTDTERLSAYDNQQKLVAEKVGADTYSYVYLGSQQIAKINHEAKDDLVLWYHHNMLGTPFAITYMQGGKELQHTYLMDPWGETLQATGKIDTKQPGMYTGKFVDAVTELYYFYARYYDSESKVFLGHDAVEPDFGNPLTINRFTYVLNNPLRYVDPDGNNFRQSLMGSIKYMFQGLTGVNPNMEGAGAQALDNISQASTDIAVDTANFGGDVIQSVPGVVFGIGALATSSIPPVSSAFTLLGAAKTTLDINEGVTPIDVGTTSLMMEASSVLIPGGVMYKPFKYVWNMGTLMFNTSSEVYLNNNSQLNTLGR